VRQLRRLFNSLRNASSFVGSTRDAVDPIRRSFAGCGIQTSKAVRSLRHRAFQDSLSKRRPSSAGGFGAVTGAAPTLRAAVGLVGTIGLGPENLSHPWRNLGRSTIPSTRWFYLSIFVGCWPWEERNQDRRMAIGSRLRPFCGWKETWIGTGDAAASCVPEKSESKPDLTAASAFPRRGRARQPPSTSPRFAAIDETPDTQFVGVARSRPDIQGAHEGGTAGCPSNPSAP